MLLVSADEQDKLQIPASKLYLFELDELIGKTILHEHEIDSTICRAKLLMHIKNSEAITDQFIVTFGHEEDEEIMNYNAITNLLNKQIDRKINDPDGAYFFKCINDHCKQGNKCRVLVDWECMETTLEPISLMRTDTPLILAKYKKTDLWTN